jgi:hypothetical protein
MIYSKWILEALDSSMRATSQSIVFPCPRQQGRPHIILYELSSEPLANAAKHSGTTPFARRVIRRTRSDEEAISQEHPICESVVAHA